jgi:hypothetical protein
LLRQHGQSGVAVVGGTAPRAPRTRRGGEGECLAGSLQGGANGRVHPAPHVAQGGVQPWLLPGHGRNRLRAATHGPPRPAPFSALVGVKPRLPQRAPPDYRRTISDGAELLDARNRLAYPRIDQSYSAGQVDQFVKQGPTQVFPTQVIPPLDCQPPATASSSWSESSAPPPSGEELGSTR